MSDTEIEWTDKVWNPTRGCSRISEGCRNCYAERQAIRHSKPGGRYAGLVVNNGNGPRWTGKVALVTEKLGEPLTWRKPARVFVDSMSDLFHEEVPDEYIADVFAVMAMASRHTFQVLTKRASRLELLAAPAFRVLVRDRLNARLSRAHAPYRWPENEIPGPPHLWPLRNVWLGVSVERQQEADERIPHLVAAPASVRFLSVEPLLGPVDLDMTPAGDVLSECDEHAGDKSDCEICSGLGRIGWVIVGGESGPGARPCDLAWVRSIVEQCTEAQVPVFVKQLGARPCDSGNGEHCKTRHFNETGVMEPVLRDRKGGDMQEWPADLRVREFPSIEGR